MCSVVFDKFWDSLSTSLELDALLLITITFYTSYINFLNSVKNFENRK